MNLNPTAASILGFLQHEPMTGYELLDLIERSVGNFWHTTKSQVYADLKRLRDAGFLEMDEVGARNQRTCQITDAGRHAFKAWIRQRPQLERVRNPLALSVFFRRSVDDDPLLFDIVREHREEHEARLKVYEALLDEVKPDGSGPNLTVRLGIKYERAMIAWMDEVAEELARESES